MNLLPLLKLRRANHLLLKFSKIHACLLQFANLLKKLYLDMS